MYSNMVAQLKQLGAEDILPRAMELIPPVRLAAGLPPLVTPTSQIVGAQAVNCAMDEKAGRAMYTNKSAQFVGLVKGDYGRTPVKISEDFREKICGFREERPYDTSKYQKQPNPALEEAGGVPMALRSVVTGSFFLRSMYAYMTLLMSVANSIHDPLNGMIRAE